MDSYADSLISKFRGKRIAIVGDLVADQFLSGTISRVSREAPVFILRHDDTVTSPGGAANAAANIASLGGTPLLIGIIGNDPNGSGKICRRRGSISCAADPTRCCPKIHVRAPADARSMDDCGGA